MLQTPPEFINEFDAAATAAENVIWLLNFPDFAFLFFLVAALLDSPDLKCVVLFKEEIGIQNNFS